MRGESRLSPFSSMAISFFSFLLYASKIKYYYWLLNEIETLEAIYEKFLDPEGLRNGQDRLTSPGGGKTPALG